MKAPVWLLAAIAGSLPASSAAALGPAVLPAGAASLHNGSIVSLGQPLAVLAAPPTAEAGLRPGLLPALMMIESPAHPELRMVPLAGWSPGGFTLSFRAQPGRDYVLWSSTNLVDWAPRQTVRAAAALVHLTDPFGDGPPWRFYLLELRPR